MRLALAFASAASIIAPSHPSPSPRRALEPIVVNDNRAAAGVLRDGVLTIRLEAREGEWHPDGEHARGIVIRAFGEVGRPLQIPGPLVRVPAGTEIHASVTNSFATTMVVSGLAARGGVRGADTLSVAPGATRSVQFVADRPGTYYYSAVAGGAADSTDRVDAELSGAIIVDPRGARAPDDRVFLLAVWSGGDFPGGVHTPHPGVRFTINGRSWPNTERLSYDIGDTVRYRIINTSTLPHPMHLHGFYFDVNSRGDGYTDSVYAAGVAPYRVVTERAAPGRTFTMTWIPTRAGNWLFHCHDNLHVLRNTSLDHTALAPEQHQHVSNHATDMMGGLVMAIAVRGHDDSGVRLAGESRRTLRLEARVDPSSVDSEPSYGYVLHDGATSSATSDGLIPGPTIVLKRGEPVTITVVNHIPEMTAVHWHGIELESYFDGVADFAGNGTHVAHAIAPNDSFEARFTPPRSGTFLYHPHADELRQQQAGMSGVLLVVDDPARYDPTHDMVVLLTVPRHKADFTRVLVNGSLAPAPLDMRVGDRYRLRIVDVHTYRPSMVTRLLRDSTLLRWRPVAKDGMDVPPERAIPRPAIQQYGNGETYDFEFVPSPAERGDLRLTVSSAAGVVLAAVPIRVR